jgi:membrane protease YdiL (CAAX protease family)
MLNKIKKLSYQYAIPAAFVAFALSKLIIMGLGQLLSLLPPTLPIAYLNELILVLVPAGLVCFFGFSGAFKKGSVFRGLFCCLPFIVVQLFSLCLFFLGVSLNPEASWRPWYLIVYGLVAIVGVGIREECIYRAAIQNIVARKHANSVKGIWITVIISSLIFGLTHATNLFFGMDPLAVLAQVISSAVLGLLFGAVYLRSGSLWALILIHTLTDVAGLATSTFLNVSEIEDLNQLSMTWSWFQGKLILWLIYIGLVAFLLRPSKCKQICESLCFAGEESESSAK